MAFLLQWQTLIGSALGPFLAVMLSVAGYLIKQKIEKTHQLKEAIRDIDTSIVRTLNDLYSARLNLEAFIKRLNEIISDVEKVTDSTTYSLDETNFPYTSIFFDPNLPNLQTGSNYLHNQVMFFGAGIEKNNAALANMKESFSTVLRKNELSAMQNQPPLQRKIYIENLKIFVNTTEGFIELLKQGCKVGQQIKIYNEKLGRARSKTIKQFENVSKPYKDREKWAANLDRVNGLIDLEVNDAIKKAEAGLERIRNSPIQAVNTG